MDNFIAKFLVFVEDFKKYLVLRKKLNFILLSNLTKYFLENKLT